MPKAKKRRSRLAGVGIAVCTSAMFCSSSQTFASVVYHAGWTYSNSPILDFDGDEVAVEQVYSTVPKDGGTLYTYGTQLDLSPSSNENNEYDAYRGGIPYGAGPTPLVDHLIGPSDSFGSDPFGISPLAITYETVPGGSSMAGNFPYPSGPQQIGLRLTLPDGQIHYGWIQYQTVYDGDANGIYHGDPELYPDVYGYAYETQPNTPILSGQIPVPEPATVTAGVICGLRVLRRRISMLK